MKCKIFLSLQWLPESYSLLMIQDFWLDVPEALTHCMTWLNPNNFSMTLPHYQYSVHHEIWPTTFLAPLAVQSVGTGVGHWNEWDDRLSNILNEKVYFLFSEWLIYNAVWILYWPSIRPVMNMEWWQAPIKSHTRKQDAGRCKNRKAQHMPPIRQNHPSVSFPQTVAAGRKR